MSSPLQFYRKLRAAGMNEEDALLAAEQFEQEVNVGLIARRANDAERQRRRRSRYEHNVNHVTSRDKRDNADPSLPPLSPEPPNPSNLSSKPPYSPPTSAERKPVADATAELFEEAWKACTEQMRKRSASKDQTQKFWLRSARKANGETQLLGALKRYLRDDPDVGRTGGPGFHIWLRDGKWEQHLPRPEPPAKPADAAVIAHRIQHFRDTGEWKPAWGDPPQERAA